MRRLVSMVVCAAMMLTALAVTAPAATAQDGEVTITILHNNDGESKLLGDAEDGEAGIARFVAALKDLQASAPGDGVVTLTSGDNFLASKEFSASLNKGAPFYDSIALSGLYDAMALGNHDFDFGPDVAAEFVAGFEPAIPFLSANADFSGEPALQALVAEGRIAASTVIETGGTQVGVIGAITPRLPNISSPRGVVISSDVAAAVNAEVATLEAAGVNKIILVSHLQGLSQDKELVPQLSGVDIVIAGGGDELLKNDGDTCIEDEDAADSYPLLIADIPVVTGPGGYKCIGQLNVTFDADGVVTAAEGASIGVAVDGPEDAAVAENVVAPIAASLANLTANVIGTSEVALDGQRSSVRTMTSNEGSLLADAILSAAQTRAEAFGVTSADVGIANGGGIRNDAVIAAGDITEADTFDIAPFGNFVVVGDVPREVFKNLMENSVSGLPETEGRFAQPAGFFAEVNLDNPGRDIDHEGDCELIGDPGSRIVNLVLDDGTEIVRDGAVVAGPPVTMATVNFLAGGGDCYPLGDIEFTPVGVVYQRALAEFIAGPLGGTISAATYPEGGTLRVRPVGSPPLPPPPPPTPPTPQPPLPRTGADSGAFAYLGFGLVGFGAAFAVARRRIGRATV